MKMKLSHFPTLLVFFLLVINLPKYKSGLHDYNDALSKCIMFFEGQRSGWLPQDQRMTWRGTSALGDGWPYTDLVGGYYDAGDNVKFNFPMAFTTTLLAWSVVEFGDLMPPNEYRNALVAIRWSTDYLLKSISQLPNRIFVQVGDPNVDHSCWERPEDMDTTRTVYVVDAPNPASDVAGETAAALAAASMAFRKTDWGYAETLLRNARKAFEYADTHRGAYSDNNNIRNGVCPFYCDWDGYQDELLWGAAWLRKATQEDFYLQYIINNYNTLGAGDSFNEFGWDNKHAGINVLVSEEAMKGNFKLDPYMAWADNFMCTLIPESSFSHIEYTPGGLIYKPGGSNMQHVTSISLLMVVYAKYLEQTQRAVPCNHQYFSPYSLRHQAKRQVDYVLGSNPKGMSYMVGYSHYYPGKIHHRGSSLPSIKDHPQKIACHDGSTYFNFPWPNPNVLVGAIAGGPGEDDVYEDDRADFRKSEPTTYINAPFVGVLAYFVANPNFS